MKLSISRFTLALVGAGLVTLYGCGGGGGESSSSPNPITLSVTSATGVAFVGAIITVTDKTGAVVGTSSAVGTDGLSTITLSAGAVAPFVLTATRTSADGATESLVSVVPTATTTTSVNITPITNLIASRLSPTGDPTKLASEVGAGTATVTAATVATTVTDVQTILQPLITAVGAGASGDPLTGTFTTDGTGYDRLLDSVKVTIIPASATTSNVEIGIKQQLPDGTPPTAIQFTNGAGQTAVASVPAIPTIVGTSLVPSGTATLIAAHLTQLTNCYALPLATRISGVSSGATTATGTEANVVAAACRDAFIQAGGVISFKSNGNVVGRDANGNGAFTGLFKEGATGVVFSQGTYEFTRGNGDIVVGYKSKDVAGNEAFDTFVLRLDTADNKLKQIGNEYIYGGGVSAYHQLRDFVNQSASNYFSTGYNLNVPLISGVAYVKVTTPKANVITLIPGSDGMVLPKLNATRQTVDSTNTPTSTISNMAPSGTTFIRVRSEYTDTASVAAHPSTRETGLFFTLTDAMDADISTYSNQSLWKFEYFDSGNVLLQTQNYKTRTRAKTIAELKTQKWANLAAVATTYLQAQFASTGNTNTPLPTANNVTPIWEVAAGALPPTQIKLFGNTRQWVSGAFVQPNPPTNPITYLRTSFNDGANVGSSIRTATIPCANGNGENHCTSTPGYQTYASMTGLHLWARDVTGAEFARFYATYNLP